MADNNILNIKEIDLYYGAAQALKKISMSAQLGKVTCILGRNGVGKTSLMRAISGLAAVKAGVIEFKNINITNLSPFERARLGIALVPQGREIFPLLNVEENLKTGYAALKHSQRMIPDTIFNLFPVLQTMLNRRGGDLSGGQQQQLAIARALITRPKILVLDEPTEGIQPSVIKDIAHVISVLRDRGDMAIILVEQYFDFAKELADHYLIMDRGEIVMQGDRQDINKREEKMRSWLTV